MCDREDVCDEAFRRRRKIVRVVKVPVQASEDNPEVFVEEIRHECPDCHRVFACVRGRRLHQPVRRVV